MKILDLISLKNKAAIVSGAAKGLGKAYSEALADAGANIVVCDLNLKGLEDTSKIINNIGREVLAVECDITNENQVKKLVKEATDKFGKIDILVNNAAAMRVNKPPEETSLDEWNFVINTNITGTFLICREVASVMKKQRSGKIINISSMSGLIINRYTHGGSYDVSKLAVVALTKALASEWAQYNINVNAVAPGYYETQPNLEFFKNNPDLYNKIIELIPLKRLGNFDEISGLIVCLASDISNYMTGTTIVIDGGYTIL
jgi:NAD(P)-dependent dehydrogenase (short-subunit alcohol dehydrogenase family)